MTASLSNFPPSSSEVGIDDGHSTRNSLIRALATEQESHQATKVLLNAEQIARCSAETKVQNLQEHTRSLLGTINMLKSIVQHNVRKEQEKAADIPDHATIEAGVARFHAEIREDHRKAARCAARNEPVPDQGKQVFTPKYTLPSQDIKQATSPVNIGREECASTLYDFDLFEQTSNAGNKERNAVDADTPRSIKNFHRLIDLGDQQTSSGQLLTVTEPSKVSQQPRCLSIPGKPTVASPTHEKSSETHVC